MLDGKIREAEVFMHHKLGHRVFIRVKSFPLKNDWDKLPVLLRIFTEVNEKQT